jgi:hypothetical protein
MKKNMGNSDRVLRLVLALLFGVLYFQGLVTGFFGIVLLVLGGIFLLTSLFGFCPLYTIARITTLRGNKKA